MKLSLGVPPLPSWLPIATLLLGIVAFGAIADAALPGEPGDEGLAPVHEVIYFLLTLLLLIT